MARTSNFIIMFNVVTLILGAIVFGMSIYVKQTFTDKWSEVISTGAVWVGIFAGLFMMSISFLGCYAARKNKKFLLCIYLLCVALILTLQIAAASVLISYSTRFDTVVKQPSANLVKGEDQYINNALMSAFNICCSGCSNEAVSAYTGGLAVCKTPSELFWQTPANLPVYCDTTYQMNYAAQNKLSWSAIPCETPGPCHGTVESNCWVYNSGSINVANYPYPPVGLDRSFCSILRNLVHDGKPLVGYPQRGGCGAGKPQGFVLAVQNYFGPKMYFAGVVFALIAVIQGSVLFVGAYVICFVSKRDVLGEDYDDYV